MIDDHQFSRLDRFNGLLVRYPRMNEVFKRFDFLRMKARSVRDLTASDKLNVTSLFALPLIAPSGSGKSRIINAYMQKVMNEQHPAGVTPVLVVELSAKLSVKNFYSDVLKAFGDPNFERGTQQHLQARTQSFIRKCGVELLIIDEVHHLISSETNKVSWDVAELFKGILNNKDCCLVLSGIGKASVLFSNNDQLARRCISPAPLDPLDIQNAAEWEMFMGFIGRLDQMMAKQKVTDGPNGLLEGDVPACLYEISGGIIGHVHQLLYHALICCFVRGGSILDRQELAKATATWALPNNISKTNPFKKNK